MDRRIAICELCKSSSNMFEVMVEPNVLVFTTSKKVTTILKLQPKILKLQPNNLNLFLKLEPKILNYKTLNLK